MYPFAYSIFHATQPSTSEMKILKVTSGVWNFDHPVLSEHRTCPRDQAILMCGSSLDQAKQLLNH
jgi:hypothetical protein